MADFLIRNISPKLRDALKARARRHSQSVSAEIKSILSRAINSEEAEETGIGTRMVELFENAGPFDLEIDRSEPARDPPDFS